MRNGRRYFILALAALLLAAACVPALADVTKVTRQDNGMYKVTRDDMEAKYFCLLPKMSDSWRTDDENYPLRAFTVNADELVMDNYYFAPGLDYWLYTVNSLYLRSAVYAYDAPAVQPFSEFKSRPSISDVMLKKKAQNGSAVTVSSFSAAEMTKDLETVSYTISFNYNYPMLATARQYIGQYVITSPNQDAYVLSAFLEELPVGHTYMQVTGCELNSFFQRYVNSDLPIPTGKYTFSLYWDGKLVDSTNFTVQ